MNDVKYIGLDVHQATMSAAVLWERRFGIASGRPTTPRIDGGKETITYTRRTSNRASQYWMDCRAKPQRMSPMPKTPSQRSGRLSA